MEIYMGFVVHGAIQIQLTGISLIEKLIESGVHWLCVLDDIIPFHLHEDEMGVFRQLMEMVCKLGSC